MKHITYEQEVADLQSENNYLLRQKICARLMRDVLLRQAVELDGIAHKARANDHFVHAQIFSDMATAARRAIEKWESSV